MCNRAGRQNDNPNLPNDVRQSNLTSSHFDQSRITAKVVDMELLCPSWSFQTECIQLTSSNNNRLRVLNNYGDSPYCGTGCQRHDRQCPLLDDI